MPMPESISDPVWQDGSGRRPYVRLSPSDVDQLVDEVKRERLGSLLVGMAIGAVVALVLGLVVGYSVARHQERQRDAAACELVVEYLDRPIEGCAE